jgi:anti-sigma regulatory factor (Ser/Thr protein kinase)
MRVDGDALPALDRFALAVAHLPDAADGGRAGGAWFDVTAIADGHLAIIVGDVGAAPTSVAGQLCRVVAGLGSERRSPAVALQALDGAARGIPDSFGSTALSMTLDPAGVLRWSVAGHPPPLTVGPGGARQLPGGQGEPLGRPSRPRFTQGEEALAVGTTVVLGIDGSDMLLHSAIVDGPDPFATALEQHHGLAPDAMAAALVAQASGGSLAWPGRTVLLARLMPPPLEQRLPADPRRLSAMRRRVASWSALAALSEDTTADLQLLLSEAASNAVEHAYRETEAGEFVYSVRRRADARIRVVVQDFGRWQPLPDDPGYRGRGLAVIHNLADEVTLDVSDHGTRIAFTMPGHIPPLGKSPLTGATHGWTPASEPGEGSSR